MRYHKIILVVGRKRCGKTTFANKMLERRKRVLVVDTFDHPGYRSFRPVAGNLVHKIKEGKYRTFDSHPIETLENIFSSMYDCTVVMEDAVKYLEPNVPKQIKAGFIDSRNRGLDIIIMFHALADVPPYLARMYNDLVLFKTDENIKNSKDKFSNYASIVEAHEKLMNSANNHDKKIISLND